MLRPIVICCLSLVWRDQDWRNVSVPICIHLDPHMHTDNFILHLRSHIFSPTLNAVMVNQFIHSFTQSLIHSWNIHSVLYCVRNRPSRTQLQYYPSVLMTHFFSKGHHTLRIVIHPKCKSVCFIPLLKILQWLRLLLGLLNVKYKLLHHLPLLPSQPHLLAHLPRASSQTQPTSGPQGPACLLF